MPLVGHDYSTTCFHANNHPSQVVVYEAQPMGNKGLYHLASSLLGKAAYHWNSTTTDIVRLFDMTATKKKKEVTVRKVRPVVDRAYYHSDAFKEKLERSMDAALADNTYMADISAWNVTVGDGLSLGDSH